MLGKQTTSSIVAEQLARHRDGGSDAETPLAKQEHQKYLARFKNASKDAGMAPVLKDFRPVLEQSVGRSPRLDVSHTEDAFLPCVNTDHSLASSSIPTNDARN